MKTVAIFSILLILPLGARAEGVSQAEQVCRQQVDQILTRGDSGPGCRQFQVNAIQFFDRDSVGYEFNGMRSNEELSFGGNHCGSSANPGNISSIMLTFMPVNRTEREPQCAIWQFSKDDQGVEIISRSIYIGDHPVQTSTMNRREYEHRGIPVDLRITGRIPEENLQTEQPSFLQRILGGASH